MVGVVTRRSAGSGNYSSGATAACATTLISNPGFENNLTNWLFNGDVQSITGDSYTGAKSAGLIGDNSKIHQDEPADQGDVYGYSVWYTKDAGVNGLLTIKFLDASGNVVGNSEQALPTSTGWSNFNISGLAPAGTATARFEAWRTSGTGIFRVDDICLVETRSGTPYTGPTCVLAPNTTARPEMTGAACYSPIAVFYFSPSGNQINFEFIPSEPGVISRNNANQVTFTAKIRNKLCSKRTRNTNPKFKWLFHNWHTA
ncbi:MAG: hypothetical protein HC821_02815 [Lewinella sp.]|nr:hypothetical protein [Lewinella sp.]